MKAGPSGKGRILRAALVAGALVAAYFLFWPAPIDPVVFTPPADPGQNGVYAPNHALESVERLTPAIGFAPEDVARGPDGLFYTGLQDGRIMRFREDGSAAQEFVRTGGRPLGLRFDARANLVVADASRGLLSIAPDRTISVLAAGLGGRPFRFANDLDIDTGGLIWFSDSSRRFDQRHYLLDFLETRATGRLLTYDPRTGVTQVRLDGLMFPNGVALGPGGNYVLVNETIAARITRLWLSGPRAGQHETLVTLPGYPDNLSYNGNGTFWVALASPRLAPLERLWTGRLLRTAISRLPATMLVAPSSFGWVIAVDTDGRVVRSLEDRSGRYDEITSVHEIGGVLYFGSIRMSSVGRYRLP